MPVQSLLAPIESKEQEAGKQVSKDAPEKKMLSLMQMPMSKMTSLIQVPKSRAKALRSKKAQTELMNLALASMKLTLFATEHLRHVLSTVYRQVKFEKNSEFYKNMGTAMDTYASRMREQSTSHFGAPDTFSCRSLIETARNSLSGADRATLSDYLTWMVPGTPFGEHEVKGCFVEPIQGASFDRLLFNLGNKMVENLVVQALENSGSEEVIGTRGAGHGEQMAHVVQESFLQSVGAM